MKKTSFRLLLIDIHIVFSSVITMWMILNSELLSIIIFPILLLIMNLILLPISLIATVITKKMTPVKFQQSKWRHVITSCIFVFVVILLNQIKHSGEWESAFNNVFVEIPGENVELIKFEKSDDSQEPLSLEYKTSCENNLRLIQNIGFVPKENQLDKVDCTPVKTKGQMCFYPRETDHNVQEICLKSGFETAEIFWK